MNMLDQTRRVELIQNSITISHNNRCYIDKKDIFISILGPHKELLDIYKFHQKPNDDIQTHIVKLRQQLKVFESQQYKNQILVQQLKQRTQLCGLDFRSGLTIYKMHSRKDIGDQPHQQLKGRMQVIHFYDGELRLYQRIKLIRKHQTQRFTEQGCDYVKVYFSGKTTSLLNHTKQNEEVPQSVISRFDGLTNPGQIHPSIKIEGYADPGEIITSFDAQYLLVGSNIIWGGEVKVFNIEYEYSIFHRRKNILIYSNNQQVTYLNLDTKEILNYIFTEKVMRLYLVDDTILVQLKDQIMKIDYLNVTTLHYLGEPKQK